MKILVGICICLMIGTLSFGQKANWQNLDMAKDSVLGISTEKIYSKLTSKKATWVIVGVLDDGVDITHEDIRASLWQNPKEKKNLKDDDKNGYIDDLNGWNFIGSNRGNVQLDNLELTRQVRNGTKYFGGKDTATLSGNDRTLYNDWLKQKDDLRIKIGNSKTIIRNFKSFNSGLKAIVRTIASENPSLSDFENYKPKNPFDAGTVSYVISILKEGKNFTDFKEKLAKDALNFQNDIDYRLNVNYDPRSIVGDDYNNLNDKHYGNSDVTGADADHGTHVAGIIAADRNNGLGIKGIADHVKIMSVRTVPDGDERDKDVANAIRYAVDNGAKVINMSFGKAISPDKAVIDEAVKYAISKDVLLVHAAGNDNKNIDVEDNFPTKKFKDGSGVASSWLEVGASGWNDDETLKASFSNYGKITVDVFAPGVDIYSSVPNNKYDKHSGTSMAAPVVAGLAALIRSYYPKLTAIQVKEIIMNSVVKINHSVNLQDGINVKNVPFSDLCISSGIVNAYNAMQLAATYK